MENNPNNPKKEEEFVPDHLLLKIIELLDRCKCDKCQAEKRKREAMLSK